VYGETAQSPVRFKINTEVLKSIISRRDEEIFKVFENTEIATDDLENFSSIKFSLEPTEGEVEDFDFDITISKDVLAA